jgi:hypothetical protein
MMHSQGLIPAKAPKSWAALPVLLVDWFVAGFCLQTGSNRENF